MTLEFVRTSPMTLVSAAVMAVVASAPLDAQRQPAPSPGRAAVERQGQTVAAPPASVPEDRQDANETRDKLQQVLEKYPPALGQVLKLDPTLLQNPDYLAPYPNLAAFVAQHPEIAHNPQYFFANVRNVFWLEPRDRQSPALEAMKDVLAGIALFSAFLVVTATLTWLIRTTIDYRRWNRISKVQTDVHTKLLDRFTANEDLLAYIQTPSGRKFLESAPIPLQEEARTIGAPFSRILWSVQAGVVLTLAGAGLLFVNGRVAEEVAQVLFVVGVLTVALGLGFVASAAVAYGISRRLGLFDRPASDHA
jgi:hypothetical protein